MGAGCSTILSGVSLICKVVPLWPGWPPAFLPLLMRKLLVRWISVEGGLLLFLLFLFNLSRTSCNSFFNSVFSLRRAAISSLKAAICASGVNLQINWFYAYLSKAEQLQFFYWKRYWPEGSYVYSRNENMKKRLEKSHRLLSLGTTLRANVIEWRIAFHCPPLMAGLEAGISFGFGQNIAWAKAVRVFALNSPPSMAGQYRVRCWTEWHGPAGRWLFAKKNNL